MGSTLLLLVYEVDPEMPNEELNQSPHQQPPTYQRHESESRSVRIGDRREDVEEVERNENHIGVLATPADQ